MGNYMVDWHNEPLGKHRSPYLGWNLLCSKFKRESGGLCNQSSTSALRFCGKIKSRNVVGDGWVQWMCASSLDLLEVEWLQGGWKIEHNLLGTIVGKTVRNGKMTSHQQCKDCICGLKCRGPLQPETLQRPNDGRKHEACSRGRANIVVDSNKINTHRPANPHLGRSKVLSTVKRKNGFILPTSGGWWMSRSDVSC